MSDTPMKIIVDRDDPEGPDTISIEKASVEILTNLIDMGDEEALEEFYRRIEKTPSEMFSVALEEAASSVERILAAKYGPSSSEAEQTDG